MNEKTLDCIEVGIDLILVTLVIYDIVLLWA